MSLLSFFYRRTKSTKVSPTKYLKRYGVVLDKKGNVLTCPKKDSPESDKLIQAYQKAWENRDFEIEKFWSRAAYFYGFIAAAFIAYGSLVISDDRTKIDSRYELGIIGLGLFLSVAWVLIIKGSKYWQENWEHHIDLLETCVSGDIYKTVYYEKGVAFSVSKITLVVARVTASIWGFLFVRKILLYHLNISWPKFISIDISTIFIVGAVLLGIILLFKTNSKDVPVRRKKGFYSRTR